MLKRALFYELKKYFNHKNALIVTGMRQVGKTTLLRQVFAEIPEPKIWFDFDNPLDQKLFEQQDYENIHHDVCRLAKAQKDQRLYVFIDEIQNFPEITKIIKFLIDHHRVKFFVTGSSNFYLKNLFPESLSGRKFLFDLPPLSFQEYCYFQNNSDIQDVLPGSSLVIFSTHTEFESEKLKTQYDEYLEFGGFPEVVITEDHETKRLVLKNIFSSFFEKDLKILADYKDSKELRDLIILLAPRVGSMLDVTKISSELGISRPKLYSYLEFLQGTFLIRLLPKFSKSLDRSIAGGKKVYFTDTGLLRLVAPVTDGQVFENAVVNQLAARGGLSFYQYRHTKEIDIIFNKSVALEIKLSGSEYDLRDVKKVASALGLKESFVVSKKYKKETGFLSPAFL